MRSLRLLQSSGDSTTAISPDSTIVVLTAMLCALIFIIGLVLIALCAWLHRRSATSSTQSPTPSKGLKEEVLKSLTSFAFEGRTASLDECAICLSEFSKGDEIRVLPECRHVFHVDCVDKWLGSHSTCPSCRRVVAVLTPQPCWTCGGATTDEEGDGEVRGAAVPTSTTDDEGDGEVRGATVPTC